MSTRPFLTTYYHGRRDGDGQYTSQGHASTVLNAARAAFGRLAGRQYEKALIHDEDGVVIGRITRGRRGISAIGV